MIHRLFIIGTMALFTIITISSCDKKVERPEAILTDAQKSTNQARFEAPTVPNGTGLANGVKHYTCPNGHPGADVEGSCSICGTGLVHNQAYHNQTPQPAGSDPNQAGEGAEPPQNSAGVWHYTCPNGHDGGSGSSTPCSVCGATLVHNTTYHGDAGDLGDVQQPKPLPTPEPEQNEAGVWHYTCPNGHEGGGGSAIACTVCGTTLEHNAAYH